MHTGYAGDYVDSQIIKEVQAKYNGAQVTKDMARRWKEQHSFVSTSPPEDPIMVDFSIEGKAMTLDITDCVQRACESIVDPIVENVKKLISESNPEFHDEFRRNMVLAGGGSGIRGLGAMIERRLSDMGDVNVHVVDDPFAWAPWAVCACPWKSPRTCGRTSPSRPAERAQGSQPDQVPSGPRHHAAYDGSSRTSASLSSRMTSPMRSAFRAVGTSTTATQDPSLNHSSRLRSERSIWCARP